RSPATAGLISCIGMDSPSNSLRGSFNQAPKRPRGRRPVAETPGPAAYDAVNAERASGKSLSPARATIGKSPRRCLERQGGVAGPGPTSYNV
ncbi:unnamed protein product, partial [Polarella glacialis]